MENNEKQLDNENPKVLRTYTSDMADVIRDNEISVIKIAIAEKEKREQEEMYTKAEGTNLSKTFLVIGGVILIIVAIVGLYFLLKKKKEKETPPPVVTDNIETFILYDEKSYINVADVFDASSLADLIKKEEPTNYNLIKALFLTKKINGAEEILTSNKFLSLINASTPGALVRSLSDQYLLGKYSKSNNTNGVEKSTTFLILETTYYDQAYASTLEWEKTILKDLYFIFNIEISPDSSLFEKSWKDIIINNRDARVLYGENGEEILYYIFVNKSKLVITSDIETLKEIIERLNTKNK